MKQYLFYILASAAVLAGCSKNGQGDGADAAGRLVLHGTADRQIETRAEVAITPAPTVDELSLRITGTDFTDAAYDKSWESFGSFPQADETFRRGRYKAVVWWGDDAAEGVDKAYYYGEKEFEIVARQTVEEQIVASLANSQTVVRATEAFLRYFHDARFTLTTGSGARFEYAPGSDTPGEPVFVKAGTTLLVSGSAKQQTGAPVTFPEQTLAATKPRTRHTFTFDAKDAGSATLQITLGEDFVDERIIAVELNDAAIPENE